MEAAQIPVSILGKMLRITFEPLRLPRVRGLRSVCTPSNAGAAVPGVGRVPTVWIGFPLRVIVAVKFSWLKI